MRSEILEANAADCRAAEPAIASGKMSPAMFARLRVKESGVKQMATQIREVARMEDPLGRRLAATELDKGLVLHRESCPIGVIGVIFESRPDVVPQLASLALKSGNAVILKGGSEAAQTNEALVSIWRESLAAVSRRAGRFDQPVAIARGSARAAGDGSRRRSDYSARVVRARSLHHEAQPDSGAGPRRGNLPRVRGARGGFAEGHRHHLRREGAVSRGLQRRRDAAGRRSHRKEVSAEGRGEIERGGGRNPRLREDAGSAAQSRESCPRPSRIGAPNTAT